MPKIKAPLSPLSHHHPLCLANQSQMYAHEAFIQPPSFFPSLSLSMSLCFFFSVWVSSSDSVPLCSPLCLLLPCLSPPCSLAKQEILQVPGPEGSMFLLTTNRWRDEEGRNGYESENVGNNDIDSEIIKSFTCCRSERRFCYFPSKQRLYEHSSSFFHLLLLSFLSISRFHLNELRQLELNPNVIKQPSPMKSPYTYAHAV